LLDIKRLQYLEAIDKYKNFTKASEVLFVSQPAISAAVSAIELEYGVKLIVRSSKEVSFTVEGEQLMFHVARILNEYRNAEQLLKSLSTSTNQTLHFGISPTVDGNLLPQLYKDFFSRWPTAQLYLEEGSMENHIEKILNGALDLTFNAIPKNPDTTILEVIPITTCQICVLMHPDHPLAKHKKINLSLLEKENLVMLDEKSMIRNLVMGEFKRQGIIPHIISYHEQISCMINMVQLGMYIGFINIDRNFRAVGCDHLVIRPLMDPLTFDAGFILKKGKYLPKIARELIHYTKLAFKLKIGLEDNSNTNRVT